MNPLFNLTDEWIDNITKQYKSTEGNVKLSFKDPSPVFIWANNHKNEIKISPVVPFIFSFEGVNVENINGVYSIELQGNKASKFKELAKTLRSYFRESDWQKKWTKLINLPAKDDTTIQISDDFEFPGEWIDILIDAHNNNSDSISFTFKSLFPFFVWRNESKRQVKCSERLKPFGFQVTVSITIDNYYSMNLPMKEARARNFKTMAEQLLSEQYEEECLTWTQRWNKFLQFCSTEAKNRKEAMKKAKNKPVTQSQVSKPEVVFLESPNPTVASNNSFIRSNESVLRKRTLKESQQNPIPNEDDYDIPNAPKKTCPNSACTSALIRVNYGAKATIKFHPLFDGQGIATYGEDKIAVIDNSSQITFFDQDLTTFHPTDLGCKIPLEKSKGICVVSGKCFYVTKPEEKKITKYSLNPDPSDKKMTAKDFTFPGEPIAIHVCGGLFYVLCKDKLYTLIFALHGHYIKEVFEKRDEHSFTDFIVISEKNCLIILNENGDLYKYEYSIPSCVQIQKNFAITGKPQGICKYKFYLLISDTNNQKITVISTNDDYKSVESDHDIPTNNFYPNRLVTKDLFIFATSSVVTDPYVRINPLGTRPTDNPGIYDAEMELQFYSNFLNEIEKAGSSFDILDPTNNPPPPNPPTDPPTNPPTT